MCGRLFGLLPEKPFGASILGISHCLLIFLLTFLPQAAFSAADPDDFVIYETQSHSAEELKAASQGVVSGARISILGAKVIVYGTKSQREKVLKLFQEIDHPLQMYTVTVRAAAKGAGTQHAHAVEGSVTSGGVGVSSKSGVLKRKGGGTVEVGSVSATAEGSEDSGSGDTSEQIQVMDGGTGNIFSDSGLFPTSVKVRVRSVGKSSANVKILNSEVSGSGVQKIETEINVPLGEWRTIGGLTTTDTSANGELLGSSKRASKSSRDVQIKVTLAKPD